MQLLLGTLCAVFASAQTPEIRGVVIEPGIEHGVPDAEIAIYELGGTPLTGVGRNIRRQAGKVITDSQGKFRFQPEGLGEYSVVVSKEGYATNASTTATVTLSTDRPRREVRFALGRTGELTGRVVDEETREPVANFTVEAAGFRYQNGVPRTAGAGTLARTDSEGRFTIQDLDPGRYVVVTYPRRRGLIQFVSPSESEVESDYERSYWPGGRDLGTAAPVTLISGGSTYVGELRLRKTPLYTVRLAIADANCTPAETVKISILILSNPFPGTKGSSEGACGEAVLLRNFQPGSYGLVLTQGNVPDRSMTSVKFDVVDKDVDLTASLVRDIEVDSRLIRAEGAAKIPFEKLKIWAIDMARTSPVIGDTLGQPQANSADSEGRFRLWSRAPFGKFQLSLILLEAANYYIKEVRLNGRIAADNLISLTGGSAPQSLEIVVDDLPATVTGVVNDDDRAVSKPYVVLSEWPMALELAYAAPAYTSGNDDGQFRFPGLAPGEYRAIAVSQADRDKLDEPGVLQRVLSGAEKITLTRGGVQTITLKLVDPSR